MNNEQMREAFERLHLGGNKQTARRNEHGDYVLPSIQDAWSGYQTCAASMQGQIDALREDAERYQAALKELQRMQIVEQTDIIEQALKARKAK